MSAQSISFEDLMAECNLNDQKQFSKLLKRNSFQASSKIPIEKSLADRIAYRITGQKIDWYKYKLKKRDTESEGPLKIKKIDSELNLIEDWFCRIVSNIDELNINQNYLLGIACEGGFLKGYKDSIFSIKLQPSINILIGDRGSGKSTTLNLLSILSDTVSEETNILVNNLLDFFKDDPEQLTDISRRVRNTLKEYSIQRYAVYFCSKQEIFCYFANVKGGYFNILKRIEESWKSVKNLNSSISPSMLILSQSEVIKISEDKNKFYLNNILDSLYPDLHNLRVALAHDLKALSEQYEHNKPNYIKLNNRLIYEFVDKRTSELQRLWDFINNRNIDKGFISQIYSYLDWFNAIKIEKSDKTILELLKGDENDFIYLYLSRIIGFLAQKLEEIEILKEQQTDLIAQALEEPEITDSEPDEAILIDTDAEIDNREDKKALEIIELDDEEISEVFSLPGKGYQVSNTETNEFQRAMEIQEEFSISDKLLDQADMIAGFLETRLRMLRSWIYIYSKNRVKWDSEIKSLADSYIKTLRSKIKVIEDQKNKCELVTELLNKDNLEINVYTQNSNEIINQHNQEITNLTNLALSFKKIINATPHIKLPDLYKIREEYDKIADSLVETIALINLSLSEPENEFLFSPINIELRQGSTYRDFNNLSFGQKCGIILKLALASTDKDIILLDQPEDNLDANAIVNMLVPTFSRLGSNRQVIIASHESNLVMGLRNSNLIILESLGENGRIRLQGSIPNRDVTREMLDILEGGVNTFDLKIRIYEEFVSRVCGLIQDMDIQLIESSFRRRTIDELRNFLQPIVSDRSLLDFLRHELKQKDPSRIQEEIARVKMKIDQTNTDQFITIQPVFDQIEKLFLQLDKHVFRMKDAIDEIRLMDIQPRFQMINIYDLLTNLNEEVMHRISKMRKIDFSISTALVKQHVYADADHLKLVFRNLINNSLRATERKAADLWIKDKNLKFSEKIVIDLDSFYEKSLSIIFSDNGSGMNENIRSKLYVERCSDQKGRDHGLGGVIISKLLNLNNGSISVLESIQDDRDTGTKQKISFNWENI